MIEVMVGSSISVVVGSSLTTEIVIPLGVIASAVAWFDTPPALIAS